MQLATQRGYSEARLRLVQTEVLDRPHDSNLTIASIARSIGLSPKQVQRLFERSGMTFTERLLSVETGRLFQLKPAGNTTKPTWWGLVD